MAKKVGVALLGLGTVGGGTYQILKDNHDLIKRTQGLDITVVKVLEKNMARVNELGVPADIVSTDINDVINDDSISIVAEFFGGIEPARTFLLKALEKGKSIVTANKELYSKYWKEFEAVAKTTGAGLYFEASCVGGVPIIRTITEGMQGNNILALKGIINGTTNYILSSMSDNGTAYADALKSAQELGFAEFDPTADVEGYDAMYKISILSTLAYHKSLPISKVYREGISKVSVEDINIGKELGLTLKLLAISKNINGVIEARVHPAFVPNDHPLASVKGSFNAVYLLGDAVGDIMLYGRGAGALPTGSAIVSDIIFAGQQTVARRYPHLLEEVKDSDFATDFKTKYYVRLAVCDECGTLSKISGVFAKYNVSITTVLQRDQKRKNSVPIIFVTHETLESNMMKALAEIKQLDSVQEVNSVIRVEE